MPPGTSKPIVVGLGELLWDCFAEEQRPGGAPANLAWHANQLGARGVVVSRVGRDALGEELCGVLRQRGLEDEFVQRDPDHATGTVAIVTDADGQPDYTIHEDVAWDHLAFTADLQALMQQSAAVCFGTIAQRHPASRQAIHSCLEAAAEEACLVYDVNLRKDAWEPELVESSLERADVAKLNSDELTLLARRLNWPGDDPATVAGYLRHRFALQAVWVTRGADGCLLVGEDGVAQADGVPIEVADTVGAGDAFTAAMIWSQLKAWPLARAAALANRIGALVASRPGGMPDLSNTLPSLLKDLS